MWVVNRWVLIILVAVFLYVGKYVKIKIDLHAYMFKSTSLTNREF